MEFCVNFFSGFLGAFLPFKRRTENSLGNPQQNSRQNPCQIHACSEKRGQKIIRGHYRGARNTHHPHKRPSSSGGIFGGVVCELSEPKEKAKYAPPPLLQSRCWSSILWGVVRGFRSLTLSVEKARPQKLSGVESVIYYVFLAWLPLQKLVGEFVLIFSREILREIWREFCGISSDPQNKGSNIPVHPPALQGQGPSASRPSPAGTHFRLFLPLWPQGLRKSLPPRTPETPKNSKSLESDWKVTFGVSPKVTLKATPKVTF